jgi:molybdopterin converting factor small subunit
MKITVKLFSFLRLKRFPVKEMDYPQGTRVQDVLDSLSITREEMAIGIIFINGLHGTFDSLLADGDTLSLFPPAAGG